MRIITIDPGTYESAFLVWEDSVIEADTVANADLRKRLLENNFGGAELCAIEMVASYGMPVGKETFETVLWIGRFMECLVIPTRLIYRKDIKMHLCGTHRAKDANVTQALKDRHGAPGTKKNKGKLYGISGHLWSCVAIADYMDHHPGELIAGNVTPSL